MAHSNEGETVTTTFTNKKGRAQEDSPLKDNAIWVQCEALDCLKWRLIRKVGDNGTNITMEQAWFCSMNPDPAYNTCSAPQLYMSGVTKLKKQGLQWVYSQLSVGSLVMARAAKWPWWPGILSPDPDLEEYVNVDSDGDVESYHVEFLGKPHTRAWILAHNVDNYRLSPTKEWKAVKGCSRRSYDLAIQEATLIFNMQCEERLQMCHFKPHALLSKAKKFDSSQGHSSKRQSNRVRQKVYQGGIEEDGHTLFIEGIRFESATCLEDLKHLSSLTSAAGENTITEY